MVTISDYRLSVSRVQDRANALERDLYNTPAVQVRALVADILADCDAILKATPLHNMTQRYREIMQDVVTGLTGDDKAAEAAISWGCRFIRR